MSLATAILQPQIVGREVPDAIAALLDDVTRLAMLIVEDAAADGPIAGAMQQALETTETALAATIQPRRLAAEARLRGRFVPVRGFVEALMQDAEGAIGDPARIIALVRKILGLAQTAAQAATLPVLRSELGFIRTLVEDDLGLTPVALGGSVTGFLLECSRLLAAMPAPPDAAGRRRVRLARAVLSRLSLRAALLVPPPLDTDALARLLHGLLTWGVATIVMVYLLAALVGSVVRGGAAVVGKTAEVAASGVGAVAGKAADAAKDKLENSDFSLDDLKAQAQQLLAQTGKPALQPQAVENQASAAADQLTTAASAAGSTGNPPAQDLDSVLKRIIASGKDTVDQVDRDAIANIVAARTGLSKPEAEQRTDAWIRQYQQARAQFEQKKAEAKAKARQAADDAASASAKAALSAAVALVLGAIAAAIGGFIARRRPFAAARVAGQTTTTTRRS